MRIVVLADIHANLTAFQAVLADASRRGGIDEVWCLGDVVGYGPDPHECIALLKEVSRTCIVGNHDLAAIGRIDTSDFNPYAATANRWTALQLSSEDIDYLKSLPLSLQNDDFTLVHGSPREPAWEYLSSVDAARENFDYFRTGYCLVGHTHQPVVFRFPPEGRCVGIRWQDGKDMPLGGDRLIINPGGVGQPRDGDPRASYAIYDRGEQIITLHRVEYDIRAVQGRMQKHGLPEMLIERLSYGV